MLWEYMMCRSEKYDFIGTIRNVFYIPELKIIYRVLDNCKTRDTP